MATVGASIFIFSKLVSGPRCGYVQIGEDANLQIPVT